MRIMARGALAGIGRLMFEFDLNQKIIVAGKTDLLFSPFQLHGEPGFVAFVAFSVFVRRMRVELGPGAGGIGHDRRRRPIQWLAVLVVDHRRMSIGRAGHRNTVEEKVKPLLFCRSTAPEQDEAGAKEARQRQQGRTVRAPPCCAIRWRSRRFFGAQSSIAHPKMKK